MSAYGAPRYWPTWLGIGLLWLLSRLPFDLQLAVGRGIGRLAWHALPARRRITCTNLSLAFDDRSPAQLRALAREVYAHVGMSLAEGASLWFRPASFYQHRFDLVGEEHLQAARARGRGVILLQAHFTLLEISAAIIGPRYPVAAVFDPPKNPLFETFLTQRRQRFLAALIENREIREMIRRLKRGEIVWYSPDQSVPRHHGGIETRFFGQPALSTAGTARIVRMTGACILPLLPMRHGRSGRYTLTIGAPIKIDTDDSLRGTQQINDLFAAQIRAQPEQYFWMHKRFKAPGPAFTDPYD